MATPSLPNTTLVTELTVHRPTGTHRHPDVPARIEQRGVYVDIEFTLPTLGVTVRLNRAERISLIEALGGHV
jgi:hypothetical protein